MIYNDNMDREFIDLLEREVKKQCDRLGISKSRFAEAHLGIAASTLYHKLNIGKGTYKRISKKVDVMILRKLAEYFLSQNDGDKFLNAIASYAVGRPVRVEIIEQSPSHR